MVSEVYLFGLADVASLNFNRCAALTENRKKPSQLIPGNLRTTI